MEKKFVKIDLDSIDMVQKAHYGCSTCDFRCVVVADRNAAKTARSSTVIGGWENTIASGEMGQ